VLASVISQVLYEWFWNGSSRPYFYWYHFSFHILQGMDFYFEVLIIIIIIYNLLLLLFAWKGVHWSYCVLRILFYFCELTLHTVSSNRLDVCLTLPHQTQATIDQSKRYGDLICSLLHINETSLFFVQYWEQIVIIFLRVLTGSSS
jgi:signal transduction histidine kinase